MELKKALDPRYQIDPRGERLHRDWEQDVDYPHDRLVVGVTQLTGNTNNVNIYNVQYPAGTVPEVEVDAEPVVRRCWVLLGTTETGNASNFTDFEFRVGTLTTYDTLGTLSTFQNGTAYTAGDVMELSVWWPVGDKQGQLLYIVPTKTGAGTDYNQKIFHWGMDVVFARI